MKTQIVLHSFDELAFVIVPTQNGTTPNPADGTTVPLTAEGNPAPDTQISLLAAESARAGMNRPLREL